MGKMTLWDRIWPWLRHPLNTAAATIAFRYLDGGHPTLEIPVQGSRQMTDLSQYNDTHCCRYCLCAGVVAHFDNCPRPRGPLSGQSQHEIGAINCGCGWHPSCVSTGERLDNERSV